MFSTFCFEDANDDWKSFEMIFSSNRATVWVYRYESSRNLVSGGDLERVPVLGVLVFSDTLIVTVGEVSPIYRLVPQQPVGATQQ